MWSKLAISLVIGLSTCSATALAHPNSKFSTERFSNQSSGAGSGLHSTIIRASQSELQAPAVEVKINGQPFRLLVDTGSADTFIYTNNTTCISNVTGTATSQAECQFGELFYGSYEPIEGLRFDQIYGTNQTVTGQFGLAQVEVAGLVIDRQVVAFVQTSTFNAFAGTSGILGMAPRSVQGAYAVQNLSDADPNRNKVDYPTVFESMYSTNQVDSYFTLALEPDPAGGYLSFGSPAPLGPNAHGPFVSAPFKGISYNGTESPTNYYPIQPDGFQLQNRTYNTSYRVVVDSGTFVSRLPQDVADTFNNAFDPPAVFDPTTSFYLTQCNATVPQFGLTIGGKTFHAQAQNLLVEFGGLCGTAITRGFPFSPSTFPDGFYVLGDLFLNGVVAVFDVGKGEMRFAERSQ